MASSSLRTFLVFDEGARLLADDGFPALTVFGLSTKSVTHETSTGEPTPSWWTPADTLASCGEIAGTGYERIAQATPAAAGRGKAFTLMAFPTGDAEDWPAGVYSCFAATSHDNSGLLVCAWDLARGHARDLSLPGVTEKVQPSFLL